MKSKYKKIINDKFIIQQFNILNIPFVIQQTIFLYGERFTDKIRKNLYRLTIHCQIRKIYEQNNFPDCCRVNYIQQYYPICKTIYNIKPIFKYLTLNQRIAVKRVEIEYNTRNYIPCHQCTVKILNGINPFTK